MLLLKKMMSPREELMRDFHDKVAFVTGGASGLGFALARAFGRARMKVMLADIDVDSLENAVAELKKDQISVRGVECDVSDRTSVQRAAAETLTAFGKVHVVCNNAGPFCGGAMELITPGDCDWIIGADLMGTIYGCQTFLPHIKAHGEGGHIVSTASLTGLFPVPGVAVHAAAKAGIIALSHSLAAELAGTSIGVSVLVPAFMRTRIVETSIRNRPKRFGERTAATPQGADQFAALVRAGMDPNEVAEKVMHGIRENELFIFSHPEWRSTLEEHFQRMLAAYPQA
jgi:NAD(P)-dependent dehydrogenase (short-subunit alcohol dehydrogenase family)